MWRKKKKLSNDDRRKSRMQKEKSLMSTSYIIRLKFHYISEEEEGRRKDGKFIQNQKSYVIVHFK